MTSPTGKVNKNQNGFTYVMALLMVAIVSISSSVAYTNLRYKLQKAQEVELLFRGQAYRQAIKSFYHAKTPHRYPKSVDDLLKDPRFVHKRHLRRAYSLPGGGEWKILRQKDGGIVGVYFDSDSEPIIRSGFDVSQNHFSEAKRYSDWKFTYYPGDAYKQK